MPLNKQLSPLHLWTIMVGMVISGEYFGWNYGFAAGGVWGLIIAAIIVTIFYVCFIFTCAELATAMPHADGPSMFARNAMGPFGGYITGIACLIEFVFAPPAIAVAIGHYLHFMFPIIHAQYATVAVFVLFIAINLFGVKGAAMIELVATVLALTGLLIFYSAGYLHFSFAAVAQHAKHLPFNPLAAIPYAIWLYLAIEGGAMAAEELKDPQRGIPRAFIASIITLATCATLTIWLVASLLPDLASAVDYPLPEALRQVYGQTSLLPWLVALLGIFGLMASLHGIIIGYSRQTFALARAGFLPRFLAKTNRFHVPHWGLIVPGVIGIIAAGSSEFANVLIIIAAFGAVSLYLLVLISYFMLIKNNVNYQPSFHLPWRFMPHIGLLLGIICFISVVYYAIIPDKLSLFIWHVPVLLIIAGILLVAVLYYWHNQRKQPAYQSLRP